MTEDDLPAVIDLQRAGAIVALAAVFPQDRYPFPHDAIRARWTEEIRSASIDTYVALDDGDERGEVVGFAAVAGSELLHFGTAIETWGSGRASELLDVIVCRLEEADGQPVLYVFDANARARRFYEKHGWRPTGATRAGNFAPHSTLLEYSLPATRVSAAGVAVRRPTPPVIRVVHLLG